MGSNEAHFTLEGHEKGVNCVEYFVGGEKPYLVSGGDDKLVNPAGSRAFAAAAPQPMVSTHCFDGMYHEIFNETAPQRALVFAELKRWLDARF